MNKQRIQVYAEPEIKRRIELGGGCKRDTPVTQYCLDAIVQQLADDDVLEQSQVMIEVEPNSQESLLNDLLAHYTIGYLLDEKEADRY